MNSPRLRRPVPALLGLVAALGLLAGCSSGGDGVASGAAPSSSASIAGTTVDAAASTPGTTGTPADQGAPVRSPGCGTSTAGRLELEPRTLAVGDEQRTYLLTTPTAHDGTTPLPLVLDFHGLGEGSTVHARMSNYSPLAEREGFVVAFPEGRFQPARWDLRPEETTDLAFVDGLLDTLGAELCLDTSRVYATGLSYGAVMTSFLACQRSDRFAAFAPVAGINLLGCTPPRPVPVITFHGSADPILRFDGGLGAIPGVTPGALDPSGPTTTAPPPDLDGPGYPATVRTWASNNGCDPTPATTQVTDEVLHLVYPCPPGQDVEFYVVLGGGHAWPGSEFSRSIASVVGYTTFDIDATELGWQFLRRFRLPSR